MDVNQQELLNEIKFSVSMCVYKNDNPENFHQAIESIINQSVKPDEIVLVVDGPIPPSIDCIIKLYEKEDFFKVIRLPENVGHGNARRTGLENCTYELVALMDADDISFPDRFEKQIRCFKEDNSLSIVGGNIKEFIDTTDNVVGIRAVPETDKEIKEYLKKRCPLNQVTVMFKVSEVKAAGGYIDWFNEEDYYLWIRMFQNNAVFKNLSDTLVYVRVGSEMYSRRGGWKYFNSEAKLQKYMLNNKIINAIDFTINVSLRFVVQVLMPNKIRGLIFAKFARIKTSHKVNEGIAMFIYSQWESFCSSLDIAGINSITASSLLDKNSIESFLVLKHDVETDPIKALELAKIESKYHHKGSYYVQGYLLENNKSISILKEIQNLGHEVSYHHDVMDSNNGDINGAKQEFEDYLKLFKDNGFAIKTVCQHGNPIVERSGYNSNRDFFRSSNIRKYFEDIYEIMVNFRDKTKTDYKYISDAGYGWKVIYDPENNDIIDSSSKDIALNNLEGVLKYIQNNESIILSTHPHRWNRSFLKAKAKNILFVSIKRIAKLLFKIPLLKKVMSRYYYLAKKI